MKRTDVLVVGSGMAGLAAALAAAERGRSVRVVSRGHGALAVSGGCIDVLGYYGRKSVYGDPLKAIPLLPREHPYRLVGVESVEAALLFLRRVCLDKGLELDSKDGINQWIPTVVGTFRPSYLCPPHADRNTLAAAEVLLMPRCPWLKDCHPFMAQKLFARQRRLGGLEFHAPDIAPPWSAAYRSVSPLDAARHVERPEGEAWLLAELGPHVEAAGPERSVVLLPPVLGVEHSDAVRLRLEQGLGCPVVEMAVPPPGVGGLRIRQALLRGLGDHGVCVEENMHVVEARLKRSRCLSLYAEGPDRWRELEADHFIIATGGFLGGGHLAYPGRAQEAIFDLDLGAPKVAEEWSTPDAFEAQPFSRLGVRVNRRLNPLSAKGDPLWENVYFVGRALAGYDFTVEKSGNGVALATGWHAAQQCS